MREKELDGVRGVAALAVAGGHCVTYVWGLPIWNAHWDDFGLLAPQAKIAVMARLATPGDAAVAVFFVLSGYVLWGSLKRSQGSVGQVALSYVGNRFMRLFPVSLVAAAIVACLMPMSALTVLQTALFLNIDQNGVLWTLQIEVVGSTLILLMWLIHPGPATLLCSALLCAAVSSALENRNYIVLFLPLFPLGAVITYARGYAIRSWLVIIAAVVALVTLCCWDFVFGRDIWPRYLSFTAAVVLVSCVARLKPPFLLWPAIQWLGAVSYPFYLLHIVGMLAAEHLITDTLVGPLVETGLLAIVSIPLALALAGVVHVSVETPGIALGHYLFNRKRLRVIATSERGKKSNRQNRPRRS